MTPKQSSVTAPATQPPPSISCCMHLAIAVLLEQVLNDGIALQHLLAGVGVLQAHKEARPTVRWLRVRRQAGSCSRSTNRADWQQRQPRCRVEEEAAAAAALAGTQRRGCSAAVAACPLGCPLPPCKGTAACRSCRPPRAATWAHPAPGKTQQLVPCTTTMLLASAAYHKQHIAHACLLQRSSRLVHPSSTHPSHAPLIALAIDASSLGLTARTLGQGRNLTSRSKMATASRTLRQKGQPAAVAGGVAGKWGEQSLGQASWGCTQQPHWPAGEGSPQATTLQACDCRWAGRNLSLAANPLPGPHTFKLVQHNGLGWAVVATHRRCLAQLPAGNGGHGVRLAVVRHQAHCEPSGEGGQQQAPLFASGDWQRDAKH